MRIYTGLGNRKTLRVDKETHDGYTAVIELRSTETATSGTDAFMRKDAVLATINGLLATLDVPAKIEDILPQLSM